MRAGVGWEEHTAVIPYVAVEADPHASSAARAATKYDVVIIDAKLSWAGSVLAVTHTTPARKNGLICIRDLNLNVATNLELVIAKRVSGKTTLVLPNGDVVPFGCRMRLRLGRATLTLSLAADDVEAIPRPRSDLRVAKGVLLGALIQGTILAIAIWGRAPVGDEEASAQATMTSYLAAIDARETAEALAAMPVSTATPPTATKTKGEDASTAKKGTSGGAGNPTRENDNGVARRAHGADTHGRSTDSSPESVETFGMIAILAGDAHGASASRSAFADRDGPSAMGSIFGSTIGDSAGFGGLGLSGVGEGGGGNGAGVPLAKIGAAGDGTGQGFGSCHCGVMREHKVRWITDGGISARVNGRLPPETIQRIVRQNFGRLRACYMKGLEHDPKIEGRVAVKFVIDRSGAVSVASLADSAIKDDTVNACVVRAYQSMEFPQPEGGIVTVVYPVSFGLDE